MGRSRGSGTTVDPLGEVGSGGRRIAAVALPVSLAAHGGGGSEPASTTGPTAGAGQQVQYRRPVHRSGEARPPRPWIAGSRNEPHDHVGDLQVVEVAAALPSHDHEADRRADGKSGHVQPQGEG